MSFAGPLCAFLSSCTWAVGVASYSSLSARWAGATIHATRAVVAGPIFLALVFLQFGSGAPGVIAEVGATRAVYLALSVICSYAVGDVVFLRAASFLGIPTALSIASTYPLWAALAGTLWRGESLSAARGLGVALVVLGTILVIAATTRRQAGTKATRPVLGVALALATSLFWALNSYAMGQGGQGVPVTVASVVRMGFALALCPVFGLLVPRVLGTPPLPSPFVLPRTELRRSGWVFLLEGVGGTFFFTYGLSHSSLAVGATLSSLAPVVALPFAVASGRERFSWLKAAGIVGVVVGVWRLLG